MSEPAFAPALAAALHAIVPGFEKLTALERLSGGASQETYRVRLATGAGERTLCLRRAPGGRASGMLARSGPGLRTEARLLQLARAAGVPEPEVVHVFEDGTAREADPDAAAEPVGEAFLMEWLEGETLGARIARAPELEAVRPRLAHQCGEILARIHGIDVAVAGLSDVLKTVPPEALVRETWATYRAFETPQPMIDFTARWLLEHLPEPAPPALVHADFRNGNLMVSPEGVVAVLDWEIAHLGDPMRDLGWICTNSWRYGRTELPVGGFGRREDLFAGYEAVSGRPVDAARVHFWEVFGSFWWAVGCLGMAEHYRTGPDKTVERPAIGRRSSECQVDCVNLLIPGPVSLSAPTAAEAGDEMPRIEELVGSVRDFLREDVAAATRGRTHFLARVAANALDVVLRDRALGPAHRRAERERLAALLGADDALEPLRWRLVHGLREGVVPLDRPGLAEHLRETAVGQLAIDQPRYSGLRTATGGGDA